MKPVSNTEAGQILQGKIPQIVLDVLDELAADPRTRPILVQAVVGDEMIEVPKEMVAKCFQVDMRTVYRWYQSKKLRTFRLEDVIMAAIELGKEVAIKRMKSCVEEMEGKLSGKPDYRKGWHRP